MPNKKFDVVNIDGRMSLSREGLGSITVQAVHHGSAIVLPFEYIGCWATHNSNQYKILKIDFMRCRSEGSLSFVLDLYFIPSSVNKIATLLSIECGEPVFYSRWELMTLILMLIFQMVSL